MTDSEVAELKAQVLILKTALQAITEVVSQQVKLRGDHDQLLVEAMADLADVVEQLGAESGVDASSAAKKVRRLQKHIAAVTDRAPDPRTS